MITYSDRSNSGEKRFILARSSRDSSLWQRNQGARSLKPGPCYSHSQEAESNKRSLLVNGGTHIGQTSPPRFIQLWYSLISMPRDLSLRWCQSQSTWHSTLMVICYKWPRPCGGKVTLSPTATIFSSFSNWHGTQLSISSLVRMEPWNKRVAFTKTQK